MLGHRSRGRGGPSPAWTVRRAGSGRTGPVRPGSCPGQAGQLGLGLDLVLTRSVAAIAGTDSGSPKGGRDQVRTVYVVPEVRAARTIALIAVLTIVSVAGAVVVTTHLVSTAAPSGRDRRTVEVVPARVFVLGDSVAMSLSYALAATAPRGTTVKDDGQFGCGLALSTAAAGLDRVAACNSASPVDEQWPAVYQTRAGHLAARGRRGVRGRTMGDSTPPHRW